jgi:hypothetical protein
MKPTISTFGDQPILGFLCFMLLAFSLLPGCKEQELPPIEQGEPVFSVSMLLQQEEKALVAGVEGAYLFTSYQQSPSGLYQFEGSLGQVGCPGCGPELRIRIRDEQLRAVGASVDPAAVLGPGTYPFRHTRRDTTAYEIAFQALTDGRPGYQYFWEFDDGTSSREAAPLRQYGLQDKLEVARLRIEGAACTSEITQEITVPTSACQADFSFEAASDAPSLRLQGQSLGQGPISYSWSLGDGTGEVGESLQHSYLSRGVYTVCLQSRDALGCESSYCRNIEVGGIDGCPVNIAYQVKPLLLGDSLGLGSVEVEWVDESGELYSTTPLPQPLNSSFEILQGSPYEQNEAGQATYQVKFSLSCLLVSGLDTLSLSISEGTFAFAYPR